MKYKHVELVTATAFFLICFFSAFHWGRHYGRHASLTHDGMRAFIMAAYPYLLWVTSTYAGFLALNFYVVPAYWLKERYTAAAGLTALVFVIVGLAFTVSQSYIRWWEYDQDDLFHANLSFFSRAFIFVTIFLVVYVLYVLARQLIIHQYNLSRVMQSKASRIAREVIVVVSIWLAVMIPLLMLVRMGVSGFVYIFHFLALPYFFTCYFINLYILIPKYLNEDKPDSTRYFLNFLSVAAVAGIIEMAFLIGFHQFSFSGNLVLFWLLPTCISAAVSWLVYYKNEETYRQLNALQTRLGASNANLQYLRSQINPHFLFNALNTLYGTALVEKAEKTGEGIQKLGDMMRFMLHENNQERIALSRELEYIHNYIDLQTMRLALSPDVTVDIQIEEILGYDEIAPMLLIPFIENAYKHGISLQQRSWINVNLYKKKNQLHLDVHNSVHPANVNDPERFQSGTGLDNVKQRLRLLYPQKHELVVRQNTKEFFVHLTLILNSLNPSA